ncbi:MAG: PleD family two-component system response regulator [Candidatus Hodarchaeota archaeon]
MKNKNSNPDILIIEDNLETVEFLTNYFELEGYSSKFVSSGKKGLDELTKIKPKVILLDIILPDMNGYELIKKIRENEPKKSIPILFLTAIPRADVSAKLEKLGAVGIISKPFNLSDFEILSKYID